MSLKDFDIGKELGKGAFGSVCIVKRKIDNKAYAMKRVKISQLSLKEKDIHEQDDYYLIDYTSNDTKNHVNKQIIIFGNNKKYFDEYLNIKRTLFPEAEYIFVSCKGKKLTSKSSEEALQKYCNRCEINKKITNHVFREIFKTVNTNRNINSDLIKIIGGWSLDKVSSSYLRSIDIPTLKMVCNIL